MARPAGRFFMGYIPEDAEWYLAGIIEEISVEGDPRNVVHKNLTLVRADSPHEAYDLALELGKQHQIRYENPSGRRVSISFRGLSSLEVVHDKLEHGAELCLSEWIGMSESEIIAMIALKEDLGVFRPIACPTGPDYNSREVLRQAMQLANLKSGAED
jgi:hypothetical protein